MRKIHPSLETYPIFEGNDQYPFCLEGLIVPVEGNELLAIFAGLRKIPVSTSVF